MRKKIFYIAFLILGLQSVQAQIDSDLLLGLQTATTTEMNAILNPITGSLVYNTTDFSIYQYTGTGWARVFDSANNGTVGTKVNFGGRWTNTDLTTDLNVTNVVAPIFGTEDYKDDGNTLYEVSGNTLIVKEAGRYDIRANFSLIGSSSGGTQQRTNATGRLAVNGTQVGARAASAYIRFASGQTQSSIHMSEILELNANDVISIIMFREGNSGPVRFNAADESSFMINKLQ